MRVQHGSRLPSWVVGLILLVLIAIGSVYAFTKDLPWGGGFELQAGFANAQNVRASAPVRIAGVNVGTVTKVEPLPSEGGPAAADGAEEPTQAAALVTMELDPEALPIHEDATVKLRPRLFLEGNLFVDLRPGSPGAPEVDEDYVIPAGQTSSSVQLDQVLTTLQADVRRDLQATLDEFGGALSDHGGAEGLRRFYASSPGAFRYSAEVAEATLGTEPHDLSRLIPNLDRVVEGLSRNEAALGDLVTNFATAMGALGAESEALRSSVAELPATLDAADPAFAALNGAFPPLRALAREALPGVESTPETLDVATPFFAELRGLASIEEARGLAADLRGTVPPLASLTARTPGLLEELRALSSCANAVLNPFSNSTVSGGPDYPHTAPGPAYQQLGYSLVGAGGESRNGDGNGQYVRAATGSGDTVVALTPNDATEDFYGTVGFPILGSMPPIDSSAKTPYRPEVPCETQEPPDLSAGPAGPAPPQSPASQMLATEIPGPVGDLARGFRDSLAPLESGQALLDNGKSVAAIQRLALGRYSRFMADEFEDLADAIRGSGAGE